MIKGVNWIRKMLFKRKKTSFTRILQKDKFVLLELLRNNELEVFSSIEKLGGSFAESEEAHLFALVFLWEKISQNQFFKNDQFNYYIKQSAAYFWAKKTGDTLDLMDFPDEIISYCEKDDLEKSVKSELFHFADKCYQELSETSKEILSDFYWEFQTGEEIAKVLKVTGSEYALSKKNNSLQTLINRVESAE